SSFLAMSVLPMFGRPHRGAGGSLLDGSLIFYQAAFHREITAARSVAVVFRLERAVAGDPDIIGLLRAEFGQLRAELVEMQLGDLFVEMLRQDVDLVLV